MQPPMTTAVNAIVVPSRGILVALLISESPVPRSVAPSRFRVGASGLPRRAAPAVPLPRLDHALVAVRLAIHAAFPWRADVAIGILEILAPDARRRLLSWLFHGCLP